MERDRVYILDILQSAEIALSYTKGLTKDEFLQNIQCQDAVIRRLEIMGEGARRISPGTRAAHPQIPWKEMIGIRNLIIHEYDDVDMFIVWETIQQNLPDLIVQLKSLLSENRE